ncbi:unnamed protein product, partial [Ectocarpus sp. 13 AM-2016]
SRQLRRNNRDKLCRSKLASVKHRIRDYLLLVAASKAGLPLPLARPLLPSLTTTNAGALLVVRRPLEGVRPPTPPAREKGPRELLSQPWRSQTWRTPRRSSTPSTARRTQTATMSARWTPTTTRRAPISWLSPSGGSRALRCASSTTALA